MSGRAIPARRAAWAAVVLVVGVALAVGAVDQAGRESNFERAQRLASEVKCPECVGQAVAVSNSARARAIRADIARSIEAGYSDEQIRQVLVERFGEEILLLPGRSGLAALVWALPVLALVLALAGLAGAFARWREAPEALASAEDRALVERARAGPA